jgi:hypothetical protein
MFTNDVGKLGPQLSTDIAKTSALESGQTASVVHESGIGIG